MFKKRGRHSLPTRALEGILVGMALDRSTDIWLVCHNLSLVSAHRLQAITVFFSSAHKLTLTMPSKRCPDPNIKCYLHKLTFSPSLFFFFFFARLDGIERCHYLLFSLWLLKGYQQKFRILYTFSPRVLLYELSEPGKVNPDQSS